MSPNPAVQLSTEKGNAEKPQAYSSLKTNLLYRLWNNKKNSNKLISNGTGIK